MSIFERYDVKEIINSGSYGSVRRGTHKLSGSSICIKEVQYDDSSKTQNKEALIKEIEILSSLDHPCIYSLFDFEIGNDSLYLVLEYLSNGSLLDMINANGPLSEPTARRLFSQLVSAVSYLHEKGIAHRDIKPENLLMDKYYNLKLIDFGLSNKFNSEFPIMKTLCGSIAYAPPEMIRGEKYTPTADVWSCGVILYVMVTGNLPFYHQCTRGIAEKILKSEPTYPSDISPSLKDLLTKMLDKNYLTRPTIQMIENHPWVDKNIIKNMKKLGQQSYDHDAVNYVKSLGLDEKNIDLYFFNNFDYEKLKNQNNDENEGKHYYVNQETIVYRIFKRKNLIHKIYQLQFDDINLNKEARSVSNMYDSPVRRILYRSTNPVTSLQVRQASKQLSHNRNIKPVFGIRKSPAERRRLSENYLKSRLPNIRTLVRVECRS